MSLTRTEIAQGCGVTPALISYYFKDKRSLLDAVTRPLIKEYRQLLGKILESDASSAEKMRRIINLLIRINTENAFLLDYLLRDAASDRMEAEDRAVIDVFHAAISGLAKDLVTSGLWRSSDVDLAEVALWGMCRAFGEALRLRALQNDVPEVLTQADSIAMKAEFVYASFTPEGAAAACR